MTWAKFQTPCSSKQRYKHSNISICNNLRRGPFEVALQMLRVNVSKYQNSRSRRQVIDFFIFCVNKAYAYGKLFSKNAMNGSAALYFLQNRGKFEIRNFASRPRSQPPFSDWKWCIFSSLVHKNEIASIHMLWIYCKTIIQYSKNRYRFEKYATEITFSRAECTPVWVIRNSTELKVFSTHT